MALRLASPGISVREVDLTRGGVDFTLNVVGGLAAPFAKGPCNEITRVNNENELVEIFGKPGVGTTDYHYETWYAASNFLSYGGKLDIVRCVGGDLNTANAAVGSASITLLLEGLEDYNNNQADDTTWYFAAKNPGNWSENIKVAIIDNAADQIITPTLESGTIAATKVGFGVTQFLTGNTIGVGTVTAATGILKGVVTGKTATTLDVKVVSTVIDGTETLVEYTQNSQFEFKTGEMLNIVNNSGSVVGKGSTISSTDWYNNQNILTSVKDGGTDFATVTWRSVLNKPKTNNYVSRRDGTNDALHVVVIDAGGGVTGDVGSVLEKFPNLSKAKDGVASGNEGIYYKDYLANNSEYVFAGAKPNGTPLTGANSAANIAAGSWGQVTQGVSFVGVGQSTFSLEGGKDYGGTFTAPTYPTTLGDIISGYNEFSNAREYPVNYLIMGPGMGSRAETVGKANKLISIAGTRKDCIAVVGPSKSDVLSGSGVAPVPLSDSDTQTKNILDTCNQYSSSSYAVIDSGYKYIFDRFNNKFRYIPTNSDVAGMMARTSQNSFPWFSPAGADRGVVNNAVKLAYNPSQAQRDLLYTKRINPVVAFPGQGIILFGDKTALAYTSAFDRINVRRLFLNVETAIERAARAQLFEFNDDITRANFVNIVEPFLRDVQAKRGITDFLVVCDESNNTADIIDANEFRADIFIKPARSINFIGLTFVATRTGISFEEVVGTV